MGASTGPLPQDASQAFDEHPAIVERESSQQRIEVIDEDGRRVWAPGFELAQYIPRGIC
jgi:hypothetical protein